MAVQVRKKELLEAVRVMATAEDRLADLEWALDASPRSLKRANDKFEKARAELYRIACIR